MKTFNQWMQNEMFGWLLGNQVPPMSANQKAHYLAMIKQGVKPQEALRQLGLSMKAPAPFSDEQGFNTAFNKGGDSFSSPERMALLKAPTTTR